MVCSLEIIGIFSKKKISSERKNLFCNKLRVSGEKHKSRLSSLDEKKIWIKTTRILLFVMRRPVSKFLSNHVPKNIEWLNEWKTDNFFLYKTHKGLPNICCLWRCSISNGCTCPIFGDGFLWMNSEYATKRGLGNFWTLLDLYK